MLKPGRFYVFAPVLVSIFLLARPALADDVVLKNGLIISGKVGEKDGKVRVERPGGTVIYARSDVKEIRKSKTVWDIYAEKREAIKDADWPAYLELAEWCRDNALPQKERELLEHVSKKAPGNDPASIEAHARLGYIKDDNGNWVVAEEYYKAKGFVKHRGRWMKPEDKAKLVAAEAEAAAKLAKARARTRRTKRKRYSSRSGYPGRYIGLSYGSSDRQSRSGGYIWSSSGYYYRNYYRSRYRYAYPYGYYGYSPYYGVPHPLIYGPTRIRITRPRTTRVKMAAPGLHYKRTRVGKGWKYLPVTK